MFSAKCFTRWSNKLTLGPKMTILASKSMKDLQIWQDFIFLRNKEVVLFYSWISFNETRTKCEPWHGLFAVQVWAGSDYIYYAFLPFFQFFTKSMKFIQLYLFSWVTVTLVDLSIYRDFCPLSNGVSFFKETGFLHIEILKNI